MIYRRPCVTAEQCLIEIGEIVVGNIPFDPDLMEKYQEEGEAERQLHIIRTGVQYRMSIDEVLGDEPSISYFVNFSEQIPSGDAPAKHSSDEGWTFQI